MVRRTFGSNQFVDLTDFEPQKLAVSNSFALSSGTGSQSNSEFTQSFSGSLPPLSAVRGLPEDQQPQQTFDIESQQEAFRSTSGSAVDNTFASFPGRVPLRQARPIKQQLPPSVQDKKPSNENSNQGPRVRIRPVGTVGNTDPTKFQDQSNILLRVI